MINVSFVTNITFFDRFSNHTVHIFQSICILVQNQAVATETTLGVAFNQQTLGIELRPATYDRLVSLLDQTVPSQDLINTVLDSPSPPTSWHLEITPAIHQD